MKQHPIASAINGLLISGIKKSFFAPVRSDAQYQANLVLAGAFNRDALALKKK